MFFHRWISSVVTRFLQKYISTSSESLSINFLRRSVSLSNVEINHDFAAGNHLLCIKGSIRCIQLKIPWTVMYRGKCELAIHEPKIEVFPQEMKNISSLHINSVLESISLKFHSESSQEPESKSFLSKLTNNIIQRISVVIYDSNLSFVDTHKCWKGNEASICISAREICCKSINSDLGGESRNNVDSQDVLQKEIFLTDIQAFGKYKTELCTFVDWKYFNFSVTVGMEKNDVTIIGFGDPVQIRFTLLLLKVLSACASSILVNRHLCILDIRRPERRPSRGDSLTAQSWWHYAFHLSKLLRKQKINFVKLREHQNKGNDCYHYYLGIYNAPWCGDQQKPVLGSTKLHEECSRQALLAVEHYNCTGEVLKSRFLAEELEYALSTSHSKQKIYSSVDIKLKIGLEDILLVFDNIHLEMETENEKVKNFSCCIKGNSFEDTSHPISEDNVIAGEMYLRVLGCETSNALKWIVASENFSIQLSNNIFTRVINFLSSAYRLYRETALVFIRSKAFNDVTARSSSAGMELLLENVSLTLGPIELSLEKIRNSDCVVIEAVELTVNNIAIIDICDISCSGDILNLTIRKLVLRDNLQEIESLKDNIRLLASQVSLGHTHSGKLPTKEAPCICTVVINEIVFGTISLMNVHLALEVLNGCKLCGEACGIFTPGSKCLNGTLKVDIYTNNYLKDYSYERWIERDGIGFSIFSEGVCLVLDEDTITAFECLYDFANLVLFKSEDSHVYLRDQSLTCNYISGHIQVGNAKIILDEAVCSSQVLPSVIVELSGKSSLCVSVGRSRDKKLRVSVKLGDGVTGYLRDVEISPVSILPSRKDSSIMIDMHLSAPTLSQLSVFPFTCLKLNVNFVGKAVALHIPTIMGFWRHFDVSGSPLFRLRNFPSRIHFSNRPSRNRTPPERSPNSSFIIVKCKESMRKYGSFIPSEQLNYGDGVYSTPLLPIELVLDVTAKESVLFYPWNESDTSHNGKTIYLFTVLHAFNLKLTSRERLTRLELNGECDIPRVRCSAGATPEDDPLCSLQQWNEECQLHSTYETTVLVKLIYIYSRDSSLVRSQYPEKSFLNMRDTIPKQQLFLSLSGSKSRIQASHLCPLQGIIACFSPQDVASFITVGIAQLGIPSWKGPGFQPISENPTALLFSVHVSPVVIRIPCLGFAVVLWDGLTFSGNTLSQISELKLRSLSCILHDSLVFRDISCGDSQSSRNSKASFDDTFRHLRRLNESEYALVKFFCAEEQDESDKWSAMLHGTEKNFAIARLVRPSRSVKSFTCTLWAIQTGLVTITENLLWTIQKVCALRYLQQLQELVAQQCGALCAMAEDAKEAWEEKCKKTFSPSCCLSTSPVDEASSVSSSSSAPSCAPIDSVSIDALHIRVLWKSNLRLLPQDSTSLVVNFYEVQLGESLVLHEFSTCQVRPFPTFSGVVNRESSECESEPRRDMAFPLQDDPCSPYSFSRDTLVEVTSLRNSLPISFFLRKTVGNRVLLLKEVDASLVLLSSSLSGEKTVKFQNYSTQCIPVLHPFCIYPDIPSFFVNQSNPQPPTIGNNSTVPVFFVTKISPLRMELTRTSYLLMYECVHRISEAYRVGVVSTDSFSTSSSSPLPQEVECFPRSVKCASRDQSQMGLADLSFFSSFSHFLNPDGAYLEWMLEHCSFFVNGGYEMLNDPKRHRCRRKSSFKRNETSEGRLNGKDSEGDSGISTSFSPIVSDPQKVDKEKADPSHIASYRGVYIEEIRLSVVDLLHDPGTAERTYWELLRSACQEEKQQLLFYFSRNNSVSEAGRGESKICPFCWLWYDRRHCAMKNINKEKVGTQTTEKIDEGDDAQFSATKLDSSFSSGLFNEKRVANSFQAAYSVFGESMNMLYPLLFPSSPLEGKAKKEELKDRCDQDVYWEKNPAVKQIGRDEKKFFRGRGEVEPNAHNPLIELSHCSSHSHFPCSTQVQNSVRESPKLTKRVSYTQRSANPFSGKEVKSNCLELVVGPVVCLEEQCWKKEMREGSSVGGQERNNFRGLFIQNALLQLDQRPSLLTARKLYCCTAMHWASPCDPIMTVRGASVRDDAGYVSQVGSHIAAAHSFPSSAPSTLPSRSCPPPLVAGKQGREGESFDPTEYVKSGMREVFVTVDAGSLAIVLEMLIESPARVLEEVERTYCATYSPPSIRKRKSFPDKKKESIGCPDRPDDTHRILGGYSSFSLLHRITGESWTLKEDMLLGRQHVQGNLLCFSHADTNHLTVHLKEHKLCLDTFSWSGSPSFRHRHASLSRKDQIVMIVDEGLTVTFVGGAIEFPFEAFRRAEVACKVHKENERTTMEESFFWSAEFLLQPYVALGEGSFFQCENVRCIFGRPSCPSFESSVGGCFSDIVRTNIGEVSNKLSSKGNQFCSCSHSSETSSCIPALLGISSRKKSSSSSPTLFQASDASCENSACLVRRNRNRIIFSISTFSICACPSASQVMTSTSLGTDYTASSTITAPSCDVPGQCFLVTGLLEAEWKNGGGSFCLRSPVPRRRKHTASVSLQNVRVSTAHAHHPNAGWSASDTTILKNWSVDARLSLEERAEEEDGTYNGNKRGESRVHVDTESLPGKESTEDEKSKDTSNFLSYHLAVSVGELKEVEITYQDVFLAATLCEEVRELYTVKRHVRHSAVEQEFLQLLEQQWGRFDITRTNSDGYSGVVAPSPLPSGSDAQRNEKGYSVAVILPKVVIRLSNHRSPLLAVGGDTLVIKAVSQPIGTREAVPNSAGTSQPQFARQRQRSVQASGMFLRIFGLGSWDEVLRPTTQFHYEKSILPSSQHIVMKLDEVEVISSVHILRKVTHVQRQLCQFLWPSIKDVTAVAAKVKSTHNSKLSPSTITPTLSSFSTPFHLPRHDPLRFDTSVTLAASSSMLGSTSSFDLDFQERASPFYMPPQATLHCMMSSLSAVGRGNRKQEKEVGELMLHATCGPPRGAARRRSGGNIITHENAPSLSESFAASHGKKMVGSAVMKGWKERARKATASFPTSSLEAIVESEKKVEKKKKANDIIRMEDEEASDEARDEFTRFSAILDVNKEPTGTEPRRMGKGSVTQPSPGLRRETSFSSLPPCNIFTSRSAVPPIEESVSDTTSPHSPGCAVSQDSEARPPLQCQPLFAPSYYTTSMTPTTHCFVNSLNQNFYLLLFPLPRERTGNGRSMLSKTKRNNNLLNHGLFSPPPGNDEEDDAIPASVTQLTEYELMEVPSMGTVSLSIPYKRNTDMHVCVLAERCVIMSSEAPRERQEEEGRGVQDGQVQDSKDGLTPSASLDLSFVPPLASISPPLSRNPLHRIPRIPSAPFAPPTFSTSRRTLRLNLQESQGVNLRTAGIRLSEIQYGAARGLIVDDLLIILSCTGDDDTKDVAARFSSKNALRADIVNGSIRDTEEVDVIQVRMHAKTTLRNETGCMLEIFPCNTSGSLAESLSEPPPPLTPLSSLVAHEEEKSEKKEVIYEARQGKCEKRKVPELSSFHSGLPVHDAGNTGITLRSGESYAFFDICSALRIRFIHSYWVYEATLLLESSTNSSFLSLYPKYRSGDKYVKPTIRMPAKEENGPSNNDIHSSVSSWSSPLQSQWEGTVLIRDNRLDQRPVVFYVAVELVGNYTSVNIVLLPRLTVVNAVGLPLRFTLWQADPLAGPPTEVDMSVLKSWRGTRSAGHDRCKEGGQPHPISSDFKKDGSTSGRCKRNSMSTAAVTSTSSSPLSLIGAHSSLQHEESLSILQCTSACNLYLGVVFVQPTGEVISTAGEEVVRVCRNMKDMASSYQSPPVDIRLQVQMKWPTTVNVEEKQDGTNWRRGRDFHLLVTIRPRQIVFSVAMWVCNMTPYSLRLSDAWWTKKMVAGVNEESGIPPSEGAPFPLGVLLYRFDTAFLQIGLDAEWSVAFSPVVGATGVIECRGSTLGIIRSCNYTIYFPNAKAYQPAVMLITPRWVFCNLTSKRLRVFLDYPGLAKIREMVPLKKRKKRFEVWRKQKGKNGERDGLMSTPTMTLADIPTTSPSLLYSYSSAEEANELSDALEVSRVSKVTAMTTFYLKPNDTFVSCVGPAVGNCIFIQEDLEGIIPSMEVLNKNGTVGHHSAQHVGMFFEAQRTDAIEVDTPGESRFNLWASPAPSQAQLATWHGTTVTAYPKAALLRFFPRPLLSLSSTKKQWWRASTTVAPHSDASTLLQHESEKGEKKSRKTSSNKGGHSRNGASRGRRKERHAFAAVENARSTFAATPTSLRSCSSPSSTLSSYLSFEDYTAGGEEQSMNQSFSSSSSSRFSVSTSSFASPSHDQFSSFSSVSSGIPSPTPSPPATLALSDHSYGSAAITTGRMSVKVTPAHNNMLLVYFRPVIATQICIHNRTLESTIVVRQEGSDRRSFVPPRQNRYFCWEEASGEHILLVHQLGCKGVWYRVDFTGGECTVRYEQTLQTATAHLCPFSASPQPTSPPFFVSTLTHSTKRQVMIIIMSTPIHPSLRVRCPQLHTSQIFPCEQNLQDRTLPFSSAVTSTSTVIQLSSLKIQHHLQGVEPESAPDTPHHVCEDYEEDDLEDENEMKRMAEFSVPPYSSAFSFSAPGGKPQHGFRVSQTISHFSSASTSYLEYDAKGNAEERVHSPRGKSCASPRSMSLSLLSPHLSPLMGLGSAEYSLGSLRTALLLCVSGLSVESVEAGNTQTSRLAMAGAQLILQQLPVQLSTSALSGTEKSFGRKKGSEKNANLNRPIVFRAVWKPPASYSSGLSATAVKSRYHYHAGFMNSLFSRQPVNLTKRYMIEGHYNLVRYPDGMQRITEGVASFAPLMISVYDKDLAQLFRELREVQQLFASPQTMGVRSATSCSAAAVIGNEPTSPVLLPGNHLPHSPFLSSSPSPHIKVRLNEGQRGRPGLRARSTPFSPENLYPSVYLSQIIFQFQVQTSQTVIEGEGEAPSLSRRSSTRGRKEARGGLGSLVKTKKWNYGARQNPDAHFHPSRHHHHHYLGKERPGSVMTNGNNNLLSPFAGLVASHPMENENEEEERFLRIDSLRIDQVTVFLSFVRDPVEDPLGPFFGSYTLMLPNRMDQLELSLRAFSLDNCVETVESLQGKLGQWCRQGLRNQWAKLTKLGAVLRFLKRSGQPSLQLSLHPLWHEEFTCISLSPPSPATTGQSERDDTPSD